MKLRHEIMASEGRNNMNESGSELEITHDMNRISVSDFDNQSTGMCVTGTGDGVVLNPAIRRSCATLVVEIEPKS